MTIVFIFFKTHIKWFQAFKVEKFSKYYDLISNYMRKPKYSPICLPQNSENKYFAYEKIAA